MEQREGIDFIIISASLQQTVAGFKSKPVVWSVCCRNQHVLSPALRRSQSITFKKQSEFFAHTPGKSEVDYRNKTNIDLLSGKFAGPEGDFSISDFCCKTESEIKLRLLNNCVAVGKPVRIKFISCIHLIARREKDTGKINLLRKTAFGRDH